MTPTFSRAFYDSPLWRHTRAAYLKKVGGLCEDCLKAGIYSPAIIVHHIQHLTPENISDPNITTGFANLKAVCRKCHGKEHDAMADRYFISETGVVEIR